MKKLDCHEDGADIRFNVNLLFKEPEKVVLQKGITVEQMYFTQVEDGWTTERCKGWFYHFFCLFSVVSGET